MKSLIVPLLSRFKHPAQKVRRDEMREAKRCINGPRTGDPHAPSERGIVHGEVVSGGRCQRCKDVHDGKAQGTGHGGQRMAASGG